MTDTDGGVQVDERGVAAGLGEAISHRHHHRFLQAEHVTEVTGKFTVHRQFGGSGIAEYRGQPEFAQQRIDCIPYLKFGAQMLSTTLPKCLPLSR